MELELSLGRKRIRVSQVSNVRGVAMYLVVWIIGVTDPMAIYTLRLSSVSITITSTPRNNARSGLREHHKCIY